MSLSGINCKNKIKGVVKHIQLGEVVSEVELETPAGIVTSVVTTSQLNQLQLHEGYEAVAIINATEVVLSRS